MGTKERSLRQIAVELGITPAYLSYMVNGKRPWREDLYERYRHLVNKRLESTTVSSIKIGGNLKGALPSVFPPIVQGHVNISWEDAFKIAADVIALLIAVGIVVFAIF